MAVVFGQWPGGVKAGEMAAAVEGVIKTVDGIEVKIWTAHRHSVFASFAPSRKYFLHISKCATTSRCTIVRRQMLGHRLCP